jgi:ribonuclease HI
MTRSIDVYVDGSLSEAGVGGWGAVIAIEDHQLAEFSGALKAPPGSSTLCEGRAAVNAIHAALSARMIRRGDRVTVWADNLTAVQLVNREEFRRRKSNNREDYCEIKAAIERLSSDHGILIEARWIAGHQSQAKAAADHRVRFNRLADQLCGIVTGARKDPAALVRGAEAHRRAVIRGQQLKAARALERGS